MNDDTIKRSDVYKAIDDWLEGKVPNLNIKDIPSADRPQGEWIITEQDNGHKWIHRKCSECGKGVIEPLGVSAMKFCPNCGTRMKGVDGKE